MAAKSEPVLTLRPVIDRESISFKGVNYELRSHKELQFLAIKEYARTFREAGDLLSIERRSAKQEKQLTRVLVPMVKALWMAPDAVQKQLTRDERLAIVSVFSMLWPATATPDKKVAQTGAKQATQTPMTTGAK